MHKGLLADINKMGLGKLSKSDSEIVNLWLSTLDSSYSWVSKKKNKVIENIPHPITDYPHIENLRHIINDKLGSDLNSCLVTFYPTGQSGISLHTDKEEVMDNRQPICVTSFGATRAVEFVKKYRGHNSRADYVLQPKEGSLYSMKPKCQDVLRHRVPVDNSVTSWRVCMSFRRIHPKNELETNKFCVQIEDINFRLNSNQPDAIVDVQSEEFKDTSDELYSPVKQCIKKFEKITQISDGNKEPMDKGKDDNIGINIMDSTNKAEEQFNTLQKRSTTVIFGTSITKHLNERRLAGRGQHCINLSKSGARIPDISEMVDNFVYSNPYAGDVNKIIFNFGTNDIKYEKFSVNKFREPVINLINKTKKLFP